MLKTQSELDIYLQPRVIYSCYNIIADSFNWKPIACAIKFRTIINFYRLIIHTV